MSSVILIGKNSFLGRAFLDASLGHHDVRAVSHDEDLAGIDFSAYDAVVNMAYHPQYMREAYDTTLDMDVKLASILAGLSRRPHFFMMSTRLVYGRAAPMPVSETQTPAPVDHYGINKLATETAITTLLGSGATILRLPNVFGFELARHTFCGIALDRLKGTGRIVLDVSPFTVRDFLPVEDFAGILVKLVQVKPPGLFNLGSGQATSVGRIVMWIVEGYGKGELLVTDWRERDPHLLCTRKTERLLGSYTDMINVRSACIRIGEGIR